MKHITCIEDLRQLHKRRVPKAFFDYADRGSYTEDTLRANSDDLQQIKFRQRILVERSRFDTSTRTRWRNLICCRSSRLARSVSSA